METSSNPQQHFIIADASGLVSLVVPTDSNHTAAVSYARQLTHDSSVVVIPSEIFAETLNILGKKFGHKTAAAALRPLVESPAGFIVSDVGEEARLKALDLFVRLSAAVSFTDCLVMTVADAHGTCAIFGFDRIFAAQGYVIPETSKEEKDAA